jgi:hypothetical protein
MFFSTYTTVFQIISVMLLIWALTLSIQAIDWQNNLNIPHVYTPSPSL